MSRCFTSDCVERACLQGKAGGATKTILPPHNPHTSVNSHVLGLENVICKQSEHVCLFLANLLNSKQASPDPQNFGGHGVG